MRLVVVILFYLLWQFNKEIAEFFHPYDGSSEERIIETYHHFPGFYYLRDKLYEVLMLIGIVIPLTPRSKVSEAALVGVLFSLVCSVADKLLQNQFEEVLRDWMVVLPASVFLGYLYYRYKWQ